MKEWTPEEVKILKNMYPRNLNRVIGDRISRTASAVNTKAQKLGLKKDPDYNYMAYRKGAVDKKTRIFIRDNYKKYTNHKLAEIAGVSESTIQSVRREYGLEKENTGCFESGHKPFNKGKSQNEYMSEEAIEASKKTRFKPGNEPVNTKWDGAISIREDKRGTPYAFIRIGKADWKPYQIYRWEKLNGEIPEGHILRCKDGNTLNCDSDNWELITRAENAIRNVNREKAAQSMREYWKNNEHPAKDLHDNYLAGMLSGGDKELREHLVENRQDLIRMVRKNYKLKRELKKQTND